MGGGGVDVKQSGQGEPEGISCGKVSVPGRGATGAKTLDGKCAWFWKELQCGCNRGNQVESRLCQALLATRIAFMIKLTFI